jgi:hypothetical protein
MIHFVNMPQTSMDIKIRATTLPHHFCHVIHLHKYESVTYKNEEEPQ